MKSLNRSRPTTFVLKFCGKIVDGASACKFSLIFSYIFLASLIKTRARFLPIRFSPIAARPPQPAHPVGPTYASNILLIKIARLLYSFR